MAGAMAAAPNAVRTGTQSVERAISVLRALAARNAAGARLVDLVADVGLTKATVRRLLSVLQREGLVSQDHGTRRYCLGIETFSLGAAAGARFEIRRLAAATLSRLAEASEDTVFLSVRSAFDAICVDRREGNFPIRTLTLAIGDRRPLGVGAGSLALLASLGEEEAAGIIAENGPRALRHSPLLDPGRLAELVRCTRTDGYSFNGGLIVAGMSAIGVAVLGPRDEPEAALSIAAIDARMQPERRAWLVSLLQKERLQLEKEIANRVRAPNAP